MKPLQNPPGLFTLNGFGLGMYGKRAADPETGTYIKTRCICAVFIPVLALDAFRVADAGGGGWYFLGKEKLGTFASLWRKCMLVTLICLIGSAMWNHHVQSPEYRAEKAIEKAVSLVAAGKPLEAAGGYRELLWEGIGDAGKSTAEIQLLLGREIASGDPKRAAAAVRYADENKVLPGAANRQESLLPHSHEALSGRLEDRSHAHGSRRRAIAAGAGGIRSGETQGTAQAGGRGVAFPQGRRGGLG